MMSNDTGAPAQIDVYAGAARVADGTFALGEPGETNALSSWISVDRPTVDLADGEQAEVAVDDRRAAGCAGGRAVRRDLGVPQGPGVERHHQRITRRGAGLPVGGAGNGPPADFTISSLTPRRTADGLASVVASVTNTGGRAVDLAGT